MTTLPARFWSKVDKRGPYQPRLHSRCWIWTGAVDRAGYGRFHWKGKNAPAYLLAFEAANGPIQRPLEPDHLCRNRPCVRSDHMEAVTRSENTRRGDVASRRKTHCPRGHPYDAVDCYGSRICRRCRRAQWAAFDATRRAERAQYDASPQRRAHVNARRRERRAAAHERRAS